MRVHGRRVDQDGGLSGCLPEMLCDLLDHFIGILIEQWVVLQYQEAVMVLFQNGHELEGRESPTYIQLSDIAVQAAEDAGIVAAYEEDFLALKVEVAVDGFHQKVEWTGQAMTKVKIIIITCSENLI
jgi:hypothetical protein